MSEQIDKSGSTVKELMEQGLYYSEMKHWFDHKYIFPYVQRIYIALCVAMLVTSGSNSSLRCRRKKEGISISCVF